MNPYFNKVERKVTGINAAQDSLIRCKFRERRKEREKGRERGKIEEKR